jgi:hypothetical protein
VNYLDAKISFVQKPQDKQPSREITVREFLEIIRNPKAPHIPKIKQIRALAAQSKEKKDEHDLAAAVIKDTLPSVILSGVITGKRKRAMQEGRMVHSGLMQLDIDAKDIVGRDLLAVRAQIENDKHVFAAPISPSGKGVKALVRVPQCATDAAHKAAWRSMSEYFATTYGLVADTQTKDPGRLFYLTHDPDCIIKESAKELPINPEFLEKKPKSPKLKNDEKKVVLVGCHIDDIDYTDNIDNIDYSEEYKREQKQNSLAERIKNTEQARAQLKNTPRLAKLYHRYITKKFTAQQGERNSQLVAMTTFLFHAVSEETTAALVLLFHDLNQDIFSDSREMHEYEMRSHLNATKETWLQSLGHDERQRYDELAEISQNHANAFRVCRELANEDGHFFLSCAQMEERIGIDRQIASRILKQFVGLGIIAMVEKGTQHRTMEKDGGKIVVAGTATTYRWRLRDTSGPTNGSNEKPIEEKRQ